MCVQRAACTVCLLANWIASTFFYKRCAWLQPLVMMLQSYAIKHMNRWTAQLPCPCATRLLFRLNASVCCSKQCRHTRRRAKQRQQQWLKVSDASQAFVQGLGRAQVRLTQPLVELMLATFSNYYGILIKQWYLHAYVAYTCAISARSQGNKKFSCGVVSPLPSIRQHIWVLGVVAWTGADRGQCTQCGKELLA